jgi:hypothetical protein
VAEEEAEVAAEEPTQADHHHILLNCGDVDGSKIEIGRSEIVVRLILAIAILAEQIHIWRYGDREASNGLPLEGAVSAAEDIEGRAIGAERAADTADTDTAADRELPRVAQGKIVQQVQHVGGDLVAAGGGGGRQIMLGEGHLVFQAPAGVGPFIADGDRADEIVVGVGLLAEQSGSRNGSAANSGLVIPTATQTQIPAVAGQGRRAESRGGNSRHGEQTKFHVFTLAKKIKRRGAPRPIPQNSLYCL